MEVNRIIKLAKNGDSAALEKITMDYKGLVYKTIPFFFLKGGDQNDLAQEGFIGLIKAIRTFDENRGAQFSTFATLCIRRHIITEVLKSNLDKHKILNLINETEDKIDLEKQNSSYCPENILLEKELHELLINYLNKNLSMFEKKVFIYFTKEYSYIEIANILNESPKKIDNAIQRIKKKIKLYVSMY